MERGHSHFKFPEIMASAYLKSLHTFFLIVLDNSYNF